MQTWELWYPEAAATGLLVARARIDDVSVVWIHAAPAVLEVVVRNGDDTVAARGTVARTGEALPMAVLSLVDGRVTRADRWPTASDHGQVVILPGGEAGRLRSWWNAADGSEWRWTVEFFNRR